MPKFSVWAMRAALIYLFLGFSFGAFLLINKAIPFYNQIWLLLPLHIEFLIIGWIVQLVFSVAFWIFPRFKAVPKRGRISFAWAALGLLNVGVIIVSVASLLSKAEWILLGRILEATAVLVFALFIWGRVKPTRPGG